MVVVMVVVVDASATVVEVMLSEDGVARCSPVYIYISCCAGCYRGRCPAPALRIRPRLGVSFITCSEASCRRSESNYIRRCGIVYVPTYKVCMCSINEPACLWEGVLFSQ